jgi:hypothetical protein
MNGFVYEPFLPRDESVPVWRYLDLDKLLWAIREKKLWLTLLEQFRLTFDSFEASVPEQTKAIDALVTRGHEHLYNQVAPHFLEPGSRSTALRYELPDKLSEITRQRKALLRAAYASCWRSGEESEAMWQLYSRGKDSVAMRTTFSKLKDSVKHDPYTMVSTVEYIDYKKGEFARHKYDYDPALHKRIAYKHEQEVRVLRAKKEDFIRAGQFPGSRADEHIAIDWEPEAIIEAIALSPLSPKVYFEVFKDAIKRHSPTLADVVQRSELTDEPLY